MKKKRELVLRKIKVAFFVLFFVAFTVFGFSELSENFKTFLDSNGELISTLAHPTNKFIRSYVNSDDYLVIISKSSFTDSIQELDIYISEDFSNFEVISDDSFIPAFTAIEIVKDLLVDVIKNIEEESDSSWQVKSFVKVVLEKIDDMDGRQLSYCILVIRWFNFDS